MHSYPTVHIDIHEYDRATLEVIRQDFGKKSMASTVNMLILAFNELYRVASGEGYFVDRPEDNRARMAISRAMALRAKKP